MFGANEPFRVTVSHSNLATQVVLYRDDLPSPVATLDVQTVGLAGAVFYDYPSGVSDGAYRWSAEEVNSHGAGPRSAKVGFETKAPEGIVSITLGPVQPPE